MTMGVPQGAIRGLGQASQLQPQQQGQQPMPMNYGPQPSGLGAASQLQPQQPGQLTPALPYTPQTPGSNVNAQQFASQTPWGPAPTTRGPAWQPPPQQQWGGHGPSQQQQGGSPFGQAPPPPPQQSLAGQALSGSPAQVSAYLSALQQVGAGGNNAMMSTSPLPSPQQPPQLLGAPVGYGGSSGSYSYNQGLGATGAGVHMQQFAPLGGPSQNGMIQGGAPSATGGQITPGGYASGGSGGSGGGGGQGGGGPQFQPQQSPLAQQSQHLQQGMQQIAQNGIGQIQVGPPGPTNNVNTGSQAPVYGYQGQSQSHGFTGGVAGQGSVGQQYMPPPSQGGSVGYTPPGGSSQPSQGSALPYTPPAPPPTPHPVAQNYGQTQQLQSYSAALSRPLSAVSDERAKTGVEGARAKVSSFLDALGAHEYEYKDKAHGEGRFVSPMAQELAKSELGRSALIKRPDGYLAIDYARAGGISLAAQAVLHERLKALEERR